jgi:hypothetical protein
MIVAQSIMVTIPVALRNALDHTITERGGTRSGFICMAVATWLARQEDVGGA